MSTTRTTDVKTLVVKIGTRLLTGKKPFEGLYLEEIVKDLAQVKNAQGLDIVIVSSGAVGCGMNALGLEARPKVLPLKQAIAAVGQSTLMHYYETLFRTYGDGLKTAQVLLAASDLDNRQTYLNVRNTVKALFDLGNVIPVVNENDSTATEELKFGDNDTLAAKIAAKIDADMLVILTDVDGLFDRNPLRYSSAKLIRDVEEITPELRALAGDTASAQSIGGMRTKLDAAEIATAAGLTVAIANGQREGVVSEILKGEGVGTVFHPKGEVMPHRKRWIAFGRVSRGAIHVDAGAAYALVRKGKSLLATGITAVEGSFGVGAAVKVLDGQGREIARGLVNYGSADVAAIKGRKSGEIAGILGRKDFDEVIHRDNLVVMA